MVKIFTFFVALGATLAASNGVTLAGSNADSVSCLTVLKVKPEANPQGKPLSMEDANINYKVYPERAYVPKQPRPRKRYGVVDGSVYMLVYPDTTPVIRIGTARSTDLTPMQLSVLRLMVQGCSNPAIAKELHISVDDVKWHIKGLYDKTGYNSRVTLVGAVIKKDFIVPGL